jgi:hypothetical protein
MTLKQLWLKALRSGDYEQCTGALRKGNCYCTLGVLCDVSKMHNWYETYSGKYVYDGPMANAIIPIDLVLRAKLTGSLISEINRLNDREAKTFKEMAYWIEKNVPEK